MNVAAAGTPSATALRFSMSDCTARCPIYPTGPSHDVNLVFAAEAMVWAIFSAKSGKSSRPITNAATSSIEPSPPKPVSRSLT
jgi:hypothetical protein